ncbi:uncharacterized protein BCR38DRAFT_346045 [Pseudomassariella vexata]|uniref:FAD-binding domain-containing protein n=1 Tax=Pseudomassariella vexata TaxID=1141098 RepID=A0A1Y2DTS5_9PEZI|nr:uncharacterized protein BCR38DRAFT_346045 [Pseudomassariella vexata]ORY62683.1 hypothetical protein BCR38DRAFT_346045 [Pseudomassariella vexata]
MTVNSSTPPKQLKVAIVGGGPGGLATAIALSKVPNVEVKLYEKAKLLREVGAGINIGPNTWNVLELLGVADTLTSGHPISAVLNVNGRTGEEIYKFERDISVKRPAIRTQRTKLQSTLLAHVAPGVIQLAKQLLEIIDKGDDGVVLGFADETKERADLVVGADGIRSVVRDCAWPDYEIKFTGTTIWRALLPRRALVDQDPRFDITGWWHLPNSHVYFSPVGEGLSEIAAREYQDPAVHGASKVVWGVPVTNEHVESHFKSYLPQIQRALQSIPQGSWREFAAFAGPELSSLTSWSHKIVLVGDSSHALSGAFGSGAGFAMEDGWVLAQTLSYFRNDLRKALSLFDEIRLPYYHRMYEHLDAMARGRRTRLEELEREGTDAEEERVRIKAIREGEDMDWIYRNDIGRVWEQIVSRLENVNGGKE